MEEQNKIHLKRTFVKSINFEYKKDITEEQSSVVKSKNSLIISVNNSKEVYFSILEYDKFKL